MRPPKRLIVALDVPTRAAAVALANELRDHVAMVKVGLEAFVAHGADLVRELRGAGLEVFLDLKLHDIPRTVAAACRAVAALDARLVTVHAQGGGPMITAARDALPTTTKVIAVTALTSLDDAIVSRLGVAMSLGAWVHVLAGEALADLPDVPWREGQRAHRAISRHAEPDPDAEDVAL